jgi:hypothetical protein
MRRIVSQDKYLRIFYSFDSFDFFKPVMCNDYYIVWAQSTGRYGNHERSGPERRHHAFAHNPPHS